MKSYFHHNERFPVFFSFFFHRRRAKKYTYISIHPSINLDFGWTTKRDSLPSSPTLKWLHLMFIIISPFTFFISLRVFFVCSLRFQFFFLLRTSLNHLVFAFTFKLCQIALACINFWHEIIYLNRFQNCLIERTQSNL